MTKTKSTKKALLASALSLLLCVSMLIGTTFAWFTDSVTSAGNKIVAGNLDVQLLMDTDVDGIYEDISNSTSPIFGDYSIAQNKNAQTLWEPGKTQVAYLAIKNGGSLALKYTVGLNVQNVSKDLYKAMKYAIVPDADVNNKVTSWTSGNSVVEGTQSVSGDVSLPVGATHYFALVIHMDEAAGNEYQGGAVNFDLTVLATQDTVEEDSFDNQYDADALFCDVTATPANAQEVINNATEGTVIGLVAGDYGDLVIQNANGSAKKNITLVSNSAVVDSVNLNGSIGITLDGLTFDANAGTTVWGYNVKTGVSDSGNVASITDATKGRANYGSQDITVKNCTFANTTDAVAAADVANYYCIMTSTYRASQSNKNYTIENCVFACNAVQYIALNYVNGEVVVADNVFGGAYGTSHNTINATSNSANWTITGNEFNNWNDQKTAIGSSRSTAEDIITTWTVTDNEFNNDGKTVVLALKTSYNADNSVVTVENNTVLNGNGTIVTTETNAENELVYAGHKIALNEGVTLVADSASLQTAINAGNTKIVLAAGEYVLGQIGQYRDIELIGLPGAVITDVNGSIWVRKAVFDGLTFKTDLPVQFHGDSTIKNCTFENGGSENNAIAWCYAKNGAVVTIENCVFVNDRTAGDGRAIHFDGSSNGTVNVKKCVFDNNCYVSFNDQLTVNFEECDFKYGLISAWGDMTLTNCTFGINSRAKINSDGKTITMNGCTVKDGSPVLSICGVAKNTKGTFVIDDEEYLLVSGAQSLKAAIDNGATKVMLADGEYDLKGIQKEGLTLVGVGNNVKMANTTNFAGNGKLGGIVYAINLENMTITDTVYTQDKGGSATFTKVYFEKGFRKAYGTNVEFKDCTFGSNSEGYALHFESDGSSTNAIQLNGCKFEGGKVHLGKGRTYAFTGCEFATGTDFQVWSSITLKGCTVNDEKVTAENVGIFFPNLDTTKVTFQ